MQDTPYSIMIVDDSEDFRGLLKLSLSGIPCTIVEASDGEEAVELFQQAHFDLILMDVIMPLMDGVDAVIDIRNIERNRSGKASAVIMLSADDSVDSVRDSLQAGADRMLLKSIGRETLLRTVEELLDIHAEAR